MALGRTSSAWYGWVVFASIMLIMLGLLNLTYGIFALVEDEVLVPNQGSLVLVDLTGWGIFLVCFGGVMALAGIGLFTANPIARWAAVALAGLNGLWQLWSIEAYPVWSLTVLALDVMVIYALTAHWFEVKAAVGDDVRPPTHAASASQTGT